MYTPEGAEELLEVTQGVAEATQDDGFSKLPSELESAAAVASEVVDYLLQGVESGGEDFADQVRTSVYSDVLNFHLTFNMLYCALNFDLL